MTAIQCLLRPHNKDNCHWIPSSKLIFLEFKIFIFLSVSLSRSRCVSGQSRRSGCYAHGTLHTDRRVRATGRRWAGIACGLEIECGVQRFNSARCSTVSTARRCLINVSRIWRQLDDSFSLLDVGRGSWRRMSRYTTTMWYTIDCKGFFSKYKIEK